MAEMKIVMALFKYFPYGGLELDFIRIALKLAGRGHKVICCAGSWEGDVPESVEYHPIPLRAWTNHARASEFERKLHAYLETERPDRFVAFNRMGGADLYFAADNCLLPAWRKKHSDIMLRYLPRYRTFLRQEKAVFAPDARTKILYIVEKQKEEYIAAYGTEPDRFFYVPPGMNEACRRPENALAVRTEERARLAVAPDELLFITVASQFRVKGADRAIRAMAHLPESVRGKCRFLLCGDEKIKPFRELAAACGIERNLIHLGAHQDIPRLLQAADLMVHPARLEAAGSVLIEAIAAGLPVICSGLCGFSNFVRDAGGIVLPEPFRDEDLLQELTRLTVNPAQLAQMKEAAIQYGAAADFYRRADAAADIIERG